MTNSEFQAAFDRHKDAIYRFAWRMTNSPAAAEDIAQEVFLFLLRQPDRFDAERGPLRPFLLGVARNFALKRFREEIRWTDMEEDSLCHEPLNAQRQETAAIVGEAVQMLPPLQREVLILAEYEQLSLQDIAEAVGSEVGTVKSRLHRARENLKRILAPFKPAVKERI